MYNLNSNDIDPFWLEEKKSTIFRVTCSKTNYPQGAAMASMKKKKKLRVGCSCWKNRGSSYSFWVGVGQLVRALMQYTIREEKVKLAATDHVSDSCALFSWLAGKGRQFYARTSFSCQEEGWKIVPIYKRRPAPGWHESIVAKKYKSQEFQNEEASPE